MMELMHRVEGPAERLGKECVAVVSFSQIPKTFLSHCRTEVEQVGVRQLLVSERFPTRIFPAEVDHTRGTMRVFVTIHVTAGRICPSRPFDTAAELFEKLSKGGDHVNVLLGYFYFDCTI
ncbi:MAG: hypothetical protein KGJ34_00425 [Patescibacteria group bacterium]|nr:hypothetical protein [Patescibacteria group bacterium]